MMYICPRSVTSKRHWSATVVQEGRRLDGVHYAEPCRLSTSDLTSKGWQSVSCNQMRWYLVALLLAFFFFSPKKRPATCGIATREGKGAKKDL